MAVHMTNKPLAPFISGLTKTEISRVVSDAVNKIMDEGGALQIAEAIAGMENLIKEMKARPEYVEAVRAEIAPHGKQITTATGAKVELVEAGTTYDYSNNPEWVRLNIEAERAIEARKELEKRLQRIEPGKMLVDEETGETLIGPIKTSKSTYRVTLPK